MIRPANPSQSQQVHNNPSAYQPLSGLQRVLLFWPIAVGGAALDLWSKYAVFEWLQDLEGERYSLIDGFLWFTLRENTGAAFSMFQGWTYFLIAVSIIALLVVTGVFFFGKIASKLTMFSLGCITAGIIGNLYDRSLNDGRVRDFIDVLIPVIDYHWPTFNVADSLLCIGVGLMILANLRTPKEAG